MKKIIFYLLFLSLNAICLSADVDITAINADSFDIEKIDTQHEDFTLWIALFGLAAVGLIGLFLSSEKLSNYKKDSKDEEDKKSVMNQKQDQILANMGQNIQDIAKKNAQTTQKLSKDKDNITNTQINQDLASVAISESKLLTITTNLIEFLRIKSKKIEIVNENLKLSNLLNDVSGTLKANTKNIEFDLVYDIKNNIPEDLNGDTLNLSKILTNLLIYCVENGATEMNLKVSKNTIFNKEENIYFTLKSNIKTDIEDSNSIFNSNYNEETENYDSLGLFIARELSSLMKGELIARNDKDKNLEFVFDIPFIRNTQAEQLQCSVTGKRVYIVDTSYESALAIKDMLSELKNNAKVERKEKYLLKAPDFSNYDLLIIDEKLFTKRTLESLKNRKCKIISVSNLFQATKEFPNSEIADAFLNRPLTKKQLSETIEQLFNEKEKNTETTKIDLANRKTLKIHRNIFKDSANISLNAFSEFRDTNVLLVEDNLINQKVLTGVLSKSGMNITVANHGQEALDILDAGQNFDIIFMDINMPVMDGYTASIKIRENQNYDNIPIVALTALTSPSEVENMFSCGMNGYLAKPLKKEKLFTVFIIFMEDRKKDRRFENRNDEEIIERLDGLNITIGISQSSSSEIFYKEILSEFQDAYGDSAKVFKKLVEDFRYEQLKMLCVDVKGLSGSIGAEDMNTLTTEILQRIMFKKYELIPTFIEQYEVELKRINKSINLYIDGQ